jgi:hypothetical protein
VLNFIKYYFLVFIVVFFASSVNSTESKNCSDILDSEQRLNCFDKSANVTETSDDNKQSSDETDSLSGWILQENKDAFTGDVSYTAAIIGRTEDSDQVMLLVSCEEGLLTIGAMVPNYIGNGADVRYKFGDAEIVRERWLGGGNVIGLPRHYNDFKRGLREPLDILFEVTNHDGSTDLVNFENTKVGRENLEKGFGDCK